MSDFSDKLNQALPGWDWTKTTTSAGDEYKSNYVTSANKEAITELFQDLFGISATVETDPSREKTPENCRVKVTKEQLERLKAAGDLDKKVKTAVKERDFVWGCVVKHLKPYLEGKPPEGSSNRAPLLGKVLDELRKKLPEVHLHEKSTQIIAFQTYINEAAQGFNRHAGRLVDPKTNQEWADLPTFRRMNPIAEKDPYFIPVDPTRDFLKREQFLAALRDAVGIDFKGMALTPQEVNEFGTKALQGMYDEFVNLRATSRAERNQTGYEKELSQVKNIGYSTTKYIDDLINWHFQNSKTAIDFEKLEQRLTKDAKAYEKAYNDTSEVNIKQRIQVVYANGQLDKQLQLNENLKYLKEKNIPIDYEILKKSVAEMLRIYLPVGKHIPNTEIIQEIESTLRDVISRQIREIYVNMQEDPLLQPFKENNIPVKFEEIKGLVARKAVQLSIEEVEQFIKKEIEKQIQETYVKKQIDRHLTHLRNFTDVDIPSGTDIEKIKPSVTEKMIQFLKAKKHTAKEVEQFIKDELNAQIPNINKRNILIQIDKYLPAFNEKDIPIDFEQMKTSFVEKMIPQLQAKEAWEVEEFVKKEFNIEIKKMENAYKHVNQQIDLYFKEKSIPIYTEIKTSVAKKAMQYMQAQERTNEEVKKFIKDEFNANIPQIIKIIIITQIDKYLPAFNEKGIPIDFEKMKASFVEMMMPQLQAKEPREVEALVKKEFDAQIIKKENAAKHANQQIDLYFKEKGIPIDDKMKIFVAKKAMEYVQAQERTNEEVEKLIIKELDEQIEEWKKSLNAVSLKFYNSIQAAKSAGKQEIKVPNIDRTRAEEILKSKNKGDFLFRVSSRPKEFIAISINIGDKKVAPFGIAKETEEEIKKKKEGEELKYTLAFYTTDQYREDFKLTDKDIKLLKSPQPIQVFIEFLERGGLISNQQAKLVPIN